MIAFADELAHELHSAQQRGDEWRRIIVSAFPAVRIMLEECYGTSDPEKIGNDEEWWPAFQAAALVKKEVKA